MGSAKLNAGRTISVNRMLGTGTEPKNIGWGTGAGTTSPNDTTLFAEKALYLAATTGSRTAGTSSAVSSSVGFTGSMSGTVLTVSAVNASGNVGQLAVGQAITGAGITAGTSITSYG